jgi:hypothetical protein
MCDTNPKQEPNDFAADPPSPEKDGHDLAPQNMLGSSHGLSGSVSV